MTRTVSAARARTGSRPELLTISTPAESDRTTGGGWSAPPHAASASERTAIYLMHLHRWLRSSIPSRKAVDTVQTTIRLHTPGRLPEIRQGWNVIGMEIHTGTISP